MVKIAHTLRLTTSRFWRARNRANRYRTICWASTTSPSLVAVGAKSEPFFHTGAKALVQMLPALEYRSLIGLDHGAVLMAPKELAEAIE